MDRPTPEIKLPDQSEDSSRRGGTRGFLISLAKVIFIAVVVFFLGQQIATHWSDIRDYEWSVEPVGLILSLVTGLVTFFIMSAVWRALIAGFGHRIGVFSAFRIFYLSNLGRYIPGKIWQLFGILYLAKRKGIPAERAGASFILVQLFAIPASFLVFVIAAQIEPQLLVDKVAVLGDASSWVITITMVLICAAITLYPQLFLAVGNKILARLGRPVVDFRLDKKVALGVFCGYGIGWICYGAAFWLFVRSVTAGDQLSFVAAVGLFNAAYQIGYLVLFAPGGFGPRELVMGLLLAPFLGPVGTAVAVAARLWAIVLESVAALTALLVKK